MSEVNLGNKVSTLISLWLTQLKKNFFFNTHNCTFKHSTLDDIQNFLLI